MISLGLKTAIDKIVCDILEYESDTFTAYGNKVTGAEARAIAAKLIESRIVLGENVDGVSLDALLEEVRG